MRCILWDTPTVGAHSVRQLSAIGNVVNQAIQNIGDKYENVDVDKYVIMPNHLHLILRIRDGGRTVCAPTGNAPTISMIVKQCKEYVTKQIGQSIWQHSFHDHIIRSRPAYEKLWTYIDQNPLLWEEDCFFVR